MNKLETGIENPIENIPQESNQDDSGKPNVEQETEPGLDEMVNQEKKVDSLQEEKKHEYKVIHKWEAELIESRIIEAMHIIKEKNIDGVVFLDKSARPIAWVFNKASSAYFKNEKEKPQIKFINIGKEKGWVEEIKTKKKEKKEIHKMKNFNFLKDRWKNLKDKNILIIDEYVITGDSLKVTESVVKEMIEPKEIHTYYIDKQENFDPIDSLSFDIPTAVSGMSWRKERSQGVTGVIDQFKNRKLKKNLLKFFDSKLLTEPNTEKFRKKQLEEFVNYIKDNFTNEAAEKNQLKSYYHLGAKRNEETLETEIYYEKIPEIINKDDPEQNKDIKVIVADPMLATGNTMIDSIERLKKMGIKEENIIVTSVISAPEGIDHILSSFPELKITVGSHDERLNNAGYIVPGLGDFGDKYFENLHRDDIDTWKEKGILNEETEEALLKRIKIIEN